MGQKVNPHGLRVGIIRGWDSRWYADDKKFSEYLVEDHKIREYVTKKILSGASSDRSDRKPDKMRSNPGLARIEIERASQEKVKLLIHCARPAIIMGKNGVEIEKLRKDISTHFGKAVYVTVIEEKRPDQNAILVAQKIATDLENRASFRRATRKAIENTMRAGAKGIKVCVSGRLGGAEIARTEHYHEGTIPLQTLRADIDYGFTEAHTTYGRIGVKVWIYKGEVLNSGKKFTAREEKRNAPAKKSTV